MLNIHIGVGAESCTLQERKKKVYISKCKLYTLIIYMHNLSKVAVKLGKMYENL